MKKIDLSFQKNVRDLGGLTGFEGKKVKFGRIYRGGFLGHVSDNDIKTINSLRLTDIVDFRSSIEYKSRPDYVFMGVKYHNFPALSEDSDDMLKTRNDYDDSNLLWFLGESTDGFGHMYRIYPELLLTPQGINAYKNFFKVLTQDNNRVVYFHCSQGKDRAGLASFLVEIALGVSYEEAEVDYLLTNESMEAKIDTYKSMLSDKPYYSKDYEQALYDVFSAKVEYLQHAIEEVKRHCGALEDYLKNVLEVDIDKLRSIYLE